MGAVPDVPCDHCGKEYRLGLSAVHRLECERQDLWPFDQVEVDRRMREAGLDERFHASFQDYDWAGTERGDIVISIEDGDGGITFEEMSKLAEVFNTRHLDLSWEKGGPLSEVTYEPGQCKLRIRGAS